jgi:hypothetical protein
VTTISRSVALLRRTLTASWASLLACPGDDFTRNADDHRGALALLDTACEDAVELGQSRSALDAIRACIAAARDTDLDVPDEEDIAAPIGHDETRETVVDVRALVIRLRNATYPAANPLAPSPDAESADRRYDRACDERNAATVRAASLAADNARLERALALITSSRDHLASVLGVAERERDAAQRLALATARERDQRISELGVIRGERDGLRVELDAAREEIRARASAIGALAAGHAPDFAALADRLDGCALHALRRIADRLDGQAAHRAAGELLAAVAYETRQMEWIASVTESDAIRGALTNRAERLREVLARFGYVSGDQVQGSAQSSVEGGEGHERTVAPATGCRESRGGELS